MTDENDRRQAAATIARIVDGDGAFSRLFREQSSWTDEQWEAHDAKIAAERIAEEQRQKSDSDARHVGRIRDAGFPLRAVEAARAADATAAALVKVSQWQPDRECVLVLSGPPGCGKTVAATHWAIQRDWPPFFLRATAFASSSRYDHEQRAKWLQARSLVLDDLGTEYDDTKGNFRVDLDELVDVFYGDRRPLLITTNLTAEMFRARYGERVYDRLRECGSWYSVPSKSMRGKAAK